MKRIALTGSSNRERTILANALSILAGFDRTLCPPYSQIAKKYDLSLDRTHCQWPDSYVYCLGAFTERVIVEQQYADHFVSDGSVLNELVWIKCRYPQMELIYEQSMIHSLEKVLAEYAANKYDFLFHIGATVTGDTSDLCLRQLFEKYNIRHQNIDPSDPENALKQMAEFMEIIPVQSATHALLKVKQE